MSENRSLLHFSPFDLRVYLRILCVCLAWKCLSTDYKALPQLIHGIPLTAGNPLWFARIVGWYQSWLLDQPWKIVALQALGSFLLLATCVTLRRWMLALGMVSILLIEWCAYQYRGTIWSFELPLVGLMFMLLWPASWRTVFTGGRETSPGATRLGCCIALYFGLAYFLCGLAKEVLDPFWFKSVHIEYWYSLISLGKGPLPAWLDPMAYRLHRFFLGHPRLSAFAALGVQLTELAWVLGLVNRWVRRIVPAMMVAAHLMMFLCSGFCFINFAVAAFAIMVPWRTIRWPFGSVPLPMQDLDSAAALALKPVPAGRGLLKTLGTSLVVALLVFLPAWKNILPYPFTNFRPFAWTMGAPAKVAYRYRLGYVDQGTGRVLQIPQDHGGFLEYRQYSVSDNLANFVQASNDEDRESQLSYIWQYIHALRPHLSNHFLLGPLALPPHVMCESSPVPRRDLREVHIVLVECNLEKRNRTRVVRDLGPIPRPGGASAPTPVREN